MSLDKLNLLKLQSKKEKLRQKKLEKEKLQQILISDNQNSHDLIIPIKLNKQTPQNTIEKIFESNKKFNNFDFTKLRKIQISKQDHSTFDGITVVEECKGLESQRVSDMYYFKVEGSNKQKMVAQKFLKERSLDAIQKIESSLFNKQSKELKGLQQQKVQQVKLPDNEGVIPIASSDEEEVEVKEKQQVKPKEQRYTKVSRYFDNEVEQNQENNQKSKICYRCGKKGHISRVCLQEYRREKCTKCLSYEHHSKECPQICFRCGQFGHHRDVCTADPKLKCQKCKHIGHLTDYCGVICLVPSGERVDISDYFKQSDLKKVKCANECKRKSNDYHFNCYNYKNPKRALPYEEDIEKPESNPRRTVFLDDDDHHHLQRNNNSSNNRSGSRNGERSQGRTHHNNQYQNQVNHHQQRNHQHQNNNQYHNNSNNRNNHSQNRQNRNNSNDEGLWGGNRRRADNYREPSYDNFNRGDQRNRSNEKFNFSQGFNRSYYGAY